jgi:hypothetical protein
MLELAGLAGTVRTRGWGAAQLRDMLETGGEAHKAAAVAMAGQMPPAGVCGSNAV